ncbi:MAG: hypothetical protein JWO56_1168, partial [Acidobacteria bacterium]|nr:hypothetical protein [Acidobacteriota bacterium]
MIALALVFAAALTTAPSPVALSEPSLSPDGR